jgi:hypothetical protein
MLQKPENKLQPKLSTIIKQELFNIPQTFGAFSDGTGKYCILAAAAKYFGYDVESDKDKSTTSAPDSIIPLTIIDRIEDCIPHRRIEHHPRCECKDRNYFHCSLMSLLIHLNDYHRMTFQQIGDWLQDKGL